MNSNWFKLVMKMTKVEYGKNLLLKGVPIIFNKGGAKLKIGENVTIKSSFLSNLVGLYSRTIIVTRASGAEIEIGDNVEFQAQQFTPARRSRLVRIPASAVTAKFWITTFTQSRQRRETSCFGMKTVVRAIWYRAEKSKSARTASSGATA